MTAISFRKATKQAAKLRLALIGPPGAGKTFTGLSIAQALGGKVAVIDTEKGSASKYADIFQFDVLEMEDSFHPNRYVEAIRAAEESGYEAIVIDSLSHAWIGKNGGLDLHDQAVARQKVKNSFTAWSDVTPHHNALVQALVQSRCHVIATMRSKVDYAMEQSNGRSAVRKVGTAPLMRDGMEYEFDVVGDMDQDNNLAITKTRCPALAGRVFPKPGAEFAKLLTAWLGSGPPPARSERPQPQQTAPAPANGNGNKKLPANGAEFSTMLAQVEGKWVEKGLCETGEVVHRMVDWAKSKGCLRVMAEWPAELIPEACAQLKVAGKELEKRKENAEASEALLNEIDTLADKLSFTEELMLERIKEVLGAVPGAKLTEAEAQKVKAAFAQQLLEAEKAKRAKAEAEIPF